MTETARFISFYTPHPVVVCKFLFKRCLAGRVIYYSGSSSFAAFPPAGRFNRPSTTAIRPSSSSSMKGKASGTKTLTRNNSGAEKYRCRRQIRRDSTATRVKKVRERLFSTRRFLEKGLLCYLYSMPGVILHDPPFSQKFDPAPFRRCYGQ